MFFSLGESRVLPCSPSCVAELTHSSPGPMLPQSTTASLRTLEYNSAAEQGSRARGDKKTGYMHMHKYKHTHTAALLGDLVFPSQPVSNLIIARSVSLHELVPWAYLSLHLHRNRKSDVSPFVTQIWTSLSCLNRIFLILASQKVWQATNQHHTELTMRSFVTFKQLSKNIADYWAIRVLWFSLHHTSARQEDADQHKPSVVSLTVISFWFDSW